MAVAKPDIEPGRTPVVLVAGPFVSGVVTWAFELRDALRDHPRYRVLLLNFHESDPRFDLNVGSMEEAHELLRTMAPVILIPSYVWDLFGLGIHPDIRCLGFCHADTAEEYYDPLEWYEPLITAFVAVSTTCHEKLAARIPHRCQHITTLPYGVTVPRALRRSYEVSPLRLLYAGRVVQLQKRVMDFIPLVRNLLERGVDFVFDVVGWGPDLDFFRASMAEVADADVVRIHGSVPKEAMTAIYQQHDVALLVSDFEGTSVTMLEAMASGTVPVVTAVDSGAASIIRHAKNGYLVPIGDTDAMAFHLQYLASRPDVLSSMGRAAHRDANAFSIESHADRLVELFDRLPPNEAVDWPYWRFRAQAASTPAPVPALEPPPASPLSSEDEQALIAGLSGDVLSDRIAVRKLFITFCFKLAKLPGLRWLRSLRPMARKLLLLAPSTPPPSESSCKNQNG